jgi:hypothetical protein
LPGQATPLPVTVTIRDTTGSPVVTNRATAAAVPTFWQTTPMAGGSAS